MSDVNSSGAPAAAGSRYAAKGAPLQMPQSVQLI
jgi:hypothetical protein